MEEEKSNIEETTQGANTSSAKKAGKKAGKALNKARKAAKKSGMSFIPSLLSLITTPIGWVLFAIIVAVLLIFIIVGVLGFLATAPGVMMEKIGEFFTSAIKELYKDPNESGMEQIEVKEEAKIDLANYIQELGYDVIGYGFLNSVDKDENGKIVNIYSNVTQSQIDRDREEWKYLERIQNEDSIELSKNNEGNHIGIFNDTNIIQIQRNLDSSSTYYYRLVNENKEPVRFFSKDGKNQVLKNYHLELNDKNEPIFTTGSNNLEEEFDLESTFEVCYYPTIDNHTNDKISIKQLCLDEIIDILNSESAELSYKKAAIQFISPIADLARNSIDTYIDDLIETPSKPYNRGTTSYYDQFMDIVNNTDTYADMENNYYKERANTLKSIQTNLNHDFDIVINDYKRAIGAREDALNSRDYLYAYILSNERMYTLHGENDNLKGDVLTVLKSVFVPGYFWKQTVEAFLGDANEKAKEGMIEINWSSAGQKANGVFDTVELDRENKILKIRRWNPGLHQGLTNVDTWSWNLNGWSGRYGKPLELSLALHLSTLAPDFVYNFCMDDDLQTKVNVSLSNIEYDATYEYVTENGTTVTNDQVEDQFNTLQELLTENRYLENVESVNGIELGKDDNGDYINPRGILTNTNIIQKKQDLGDSYTDTCSYKLVDENKNPVSFFTEDGTDTNLQNLHFTYNEDGEPIFKIGSQNIEEYSSTDPEYGFGVYYSSTNDIIWLKQLCLDEIIKVLSSENADVFYKKVAIQYLEPIAQLSLDTIDTYIDDFIENPSQTYSRGEEKYYDQFMNILNDTDILNDMEYEYYKERADKLRDIQSKINNDFDIVVQDYKKTYDDRIETITSWGLDLETLEMLYNVMKEANKNIKTYQPYITSVKNHWRKDIYFEYTDEEKDKIKNLSVDELNQNSIYSNKDPREDMTQDYTPEGIANQENIETLNEKGQLRVNLKVKSGSLKEQGNKQPGYVDTEPWHWKVKNWIQYGYYFIYDGTEKTANEIKRAKEYLKEQDLYDPAQPLLGVNGENEEVDVAEIDRIASDINNELKQKGFKVKLQKISFAKKSSLAAFSILESVHSLDAEYVYHDLKEFLIELGYFTRADFETIETKELDWILPDYQEINWPAYKFEKKDTEYGTYILSKVSVDKIKNGKIEADEDADKTENTKDIDVVGFEGGLDVITPGAGIVKEIDSNSISIEFTEPEIIKGMTIKIEGIEVDTATIEKGDSLEKKQTIGKTYENKDIKLLMRDEKKAIVNNIEEYINSPKFTTGNTNIGTSTGEIEDALQFIWRWEGVSDADPNDGDYYTVCYPSGDIPTVGHGVTGWTWPTWHELGYSQYIAAGDGSSPGRFLQTKIPKSVVDKVSQVIIEKEMADIDATLAEKGITGWGIDQKAAYISLKYNGFASKRALILDAFARGDGAEAKRIWLDCYNRDQYAYGHKRRRATELEIFYEGHYCTTDAEIDAAYSKYYE